VSLVATNSAPAGPETSQYRTITQVGSERMTTIARADVAHFLVAEVSDRRFSHRTVNLTRSTSHMATTSTSTTPRLGIPRPVQVSAWILIGAGCFVFYVYTFQLSISFPNANLDSDSAKMGFASTGVRILGSVLALVISVWANDARWLFITLISRIFIELGDTVVGLVLDGPTANTGAPLVLTAVEVRATLRLWQVIRVARI